MSLLRPDQIAKIDAASAICRACPQHERFTKVTVVCKAKGCATCNRHVSFINHACPLRKWDHTATTAPVKTTIHQPVDESSAHRSFVISMSSERLERFKARMSVIPHDLIREPEVFTAINGSRFTPPEWFKAGRGAWGCYRSHMTILERAISEGWPSVAIFEDDAIPRDNFAGMLKGYLDSLPSDWEMAYLGGQHLHRDVAAPTRVNDQVVKAHNINRTHGYILRGDGIKKVWSFLMDYDSWKKDPAHHIDHRYGVFHASGAINVYAPMKWLVGQAAGRSGIAGKFFPVRFFENNIVADANPVFVLGPWHGGTSAVAGVLHALGAQMGEPWSSGSRTNYPHYEEKNLFHTLHRLINENAFVDDPRSVVSTINRQEVESELRGLFASSLQAWKHPFLCLVAQEIVSACEANCRFIVVDRPVEKVVAALQASGWFGSPSPEILRRAVTSLISQRDAIMDRIHQDRVLRVSYEKMLDDPAESVARIAGFAGLQKGDIEKAIKIINPLMNHH